MSRAAGISRCIVIAALSACARSEEAPQPAERPTVVVAATVQQTVPVYADHVGQTLAVESVELRARVEGFLQQIAFTEGTVVSQGQVLFVIDPRPFQEALRQAEARLGESQAALRQAQQSRELQETEAQLARSEATLVRAQRDATRARQLYDRELIAAADLDAAVAAEKEAQAAVDASRETVAQARVTQRAAIEQATAAIEADRAAIAQARLNLGYTTIRSPLAGLIGRANVHVGSFVGRGEPTLLATVSRVHPIDVSFSPTERQYLEAVQQLAGGKPALKGVTTRFPVTLILADGSRYPHEGVVNFVDRAVNPETNTLVVRARFPNPDGLLRPGGNVRVRVRLSERPNALLVPQRAVQQGQEGTSVFVVGPDGTVERRTVETGSRHDSLWLIERGLNAGELVVVEGIQKIRPGIKVATTPAPADESTPAPPPSGPRGS